MTLNPNGVMTDFSLHIEPLSYLLMPSVFSNYKIHFQFGAVFSVICSFDISRGYVLYDWQCDIPSNKIGWS